MSADFETRFLTGIAGLLADHGVATWRPSGAYEADEVAIVLDTIPQTPEAVVALATYGVTDNPSLSDSVLGLQVTTRVAGQDPNGSRDLAGAVFDVLHGLEQTTLVGGVHLVHCLRQSHTSIGTDQNSRWRRVQNFYVDVHRPSPHRQ